MFSVFYPFLCQSQVILQVVSAPHPFSASQKQTNQPFLQAQYLVLPKQELQYQC